MHKGVVWRLSVNRPELALCCVQVPRRRSPGFGRGSVPWNPFAGGPMSGSEQESPQQVKLRLVCAVLRGALALAADVGQAYAPGFAGEESSVRRIKVARGIASSRASSSSTSSTSSKPEGMLGSGGASASGRCIVYCFKRSTCEEVAESLRGAGLSARPYHAGLSASDRGSA